MKFFGNEPADRLLGYASPNHQLPAVLQTVAQPTCKLTIGFPAFKKNTAIKSRVDCTNQRELTPYQNDSKLPSTTTAKHASAG